jgi:hypothetical protein
MEHSFPYCALILCLSKSATSLITVLNLFVLHNICYERRTCTKIDFLIFWLELAPQLHT